VGARHDGDVVVDDQGRRFDGPPYARGARPVGVRRGRRGVLAEFGVNGKHAVTVRHVLAMEAGLYDVRHLIDDPQEMLDHQAMSEALAVARPAHAPGSANGYHAFTYGWIVGELVRRISGDSLGSVVRSQIAEPLDLDGCYIGTPVHEIDRVAARPKLKPESAAARTVAKLIDPATRLIGFSPARFAAAFLPRGGSDLIPRAEFLSAEVPAVNGVFTARSLARLYAVLGSDDGVDGIHLWTGQTRAFAAQRQNHRRDLVVPIRAGWQLGFHPPYPVKHTSERAFGFYGAYGSGGFADPDREVGVGFVVQEAKGIPLAKLAPLISAAVDRRQRS
jgi:CubicO group peptidase (beta-lactamase class C family)